MNKCIGHLKGPNIQYFMDDIIIAGNSIQEIQELLQKVFDNLIKFNLTLDPSKLQLCKPEITYLGFKVNKHGFSPSEENIKKVTKFPIPKNLKQTQTFLGMINYFRHLIPNYAELAQPIVKLTKKNVQFDWDETCQLAFEKIQNIIISQPTVKNFEKDKTLYLVCDASQISICGILMQKHKEQFYPVQFFSRQLSTAESRYPSIRRELLAIYASVKYFYEKIYGKKFIILTDAKPLTFHINLEKQPEIVARWILYLQQFDFTMEHIPGKNNPADFLSRMCTENLESVEINNIYSADDKLNIRNIEAEQLKDIEINEIIKKIKEKDSTISKEYFIDNNMNILMKRCNYDTNKSKNKTLINAIVIPKSLRKECIAVAHIPHFGTEKTYNFLKYKYCWKGMYSDTKSYVQNCSACLAAKSKNSGKITEQIEKQHFAPGEFIAVDIVGKLPRSTTNKNFILTIIDHYSRFLEAIPLGNITSTSIINALNEYFSRYGIPKIILSDNASNFCSAEFELFCKQLNIQHRKTSVYHPTSNGLIERIHRTMKESITAMSNKTFDWHKSLLIFKLHYNNSQHSVTKYSPAEIFFGRKQNLPLHVYQNPTFSSDVSEYIKKIEELNHEKVIEIAKNVNETIKENDKCNDNKKTREFEIGDKVFVKNFNNVSTFQDKYDGPWEVTKKFRNNNYLVQKQSEEKLLTRKFHVNDLYLQTELRENIKEIE